jgi:hypothetical protein
VSISADDDTDSTMLDSEYGSKHDPDGNMCIQHDDEAPDGVD